MASEPNPGSSRVGPRRRGRPPAGSKAAPDSVLLPAALEAFAASGFDGTSVRDLCRQVGVSHNHIVARFGSKLQLWYAAVDYGFSELGAQLAAALEPDPGDDLARLRAVFVRFVELSAKSPALLRVMNQEATRPGPRLDHMFERFIAPAASVMGTVLERLHRAGKARTIDPATIHFLVAHGAGGPLSLPALAAKFGAPDRSDHQSVTRYAEMVTDILLYGIANPDPGKKS